MDWQNHLLKDHDNAQFLATELAGMKGVKINPKTVETNILYFTFEPELMERLKIDYRGFATKMKEQEGILCNAGFLNDYIRFVTHRDVSRKECEKAIKAVKKLIA